jgi:hypothetical protein
MTQHHHEEEEKSPVPMYRLVGTLGGLFVGTILGSGLIWIPILGIFGLLFGGFFYRVFVNGR